MNILVCIKRVPDIGAKVELTEDQRSIVTRNLGFTISPHEECAVEEAILQIERHEGDSTVLTLGPQEALEQIRDSLARGVGRGVLLEADGSEWDPGETARAVVETIHARREAGESYDLFLFGNEAADTGDFQVGVRVAYALGLPCVTGVKAIEILNGNVVARREIDSGWEIYEVPLPAVVTVKEGINLPRYASLRGTMKAKKKPVDQIQPCSTGAALEMKRLHHPPEQGKQVEMLGEGAAAAPRIVDLLKSLEVIPS
ncbi:MAG TPA: electron transfer flavoprotein beta subunit/FixA family protein [Desulfobacteraceae bacterium]|nr:electron transfer flavoprotein beta subunit/FixA family protein [Desulfobacteraceae bacterium]